MSARDILSRVGWVGLGLGGLALVAAAGIGGRLGNRGPVPGQLIALNPDQTWRSPVSGLTGDPDANEVRFALRTVGGG